MNKKTLLLPLPAAALVALLSGCVGTGPNTQQGAVTGGALGALAGAIIGNNSGGGNGLGGAAIGAAVGALAGGTMGNQADNQRGTLYGEPSGPRGRYYSSANPPQTPPTPVVVETFSPPPAPNSLWIPGYWSYDGYRYTWAAAHWEIPPQNARAYVTAHWEGRRGGYVFVPSYWR
jgi:hypothetical protein